MKFYVAPPATGNPNFVGTFKALRVGALSQTIAPGFGQIALSQAGQIVWGTSGNCTFGFNGGGAGAYLGTNSATANVLQFTVYDLNGVTLFAVVEQTGGANGGIATAPLASSAPTGGNVAFGAAWHNTNKWDVTLQLVLAITANTSLVIQLGVGPTNTPAQQTLVTGVTLTGLVPLTVRVPAGYYCLLSESGTGTVSIIGQQQFHN